MDSSMVGAEKIRAAANMDTLIVLPKRRGVDTKISWGVESLRHEMMIHVIIMRRRKI